MVLWTKTWFPNSGGPERVPIITSSKAQYFHPYNGEKSYLLHMVIRRIKRLKSSKVQTVLSMPEKY